METWKQNKRGQCLSFGKCSPSSLRYASRNRKTAYPTHYGRIASWHLWHNAWVSFDSCASKFLSFPCVFSCFRYFTSILVSVVFVFHPQSNHSFVENNLMNDIIYNLLLHSWDVNNLWSESSSTGKISRNMRPFGVYLFCVY